MHRGRDDSRLEVWAPTAQRVECVSGALRVAMTKTDGGWWGLDLADLGVGADPFDYAVSVDGGTARADPRARWLPEGVHGPARRVDPALFNRSTAFRAPPLAAAVIYELHVGTFSRAGTFEGAIAHLDHLAELGVTHVELMPVNSFSGPRGWGYDGVGLFAPHEAYGGPEGLVRLIDACHERGLAVLIDVVYNHLGPDGNYLGQFGPYFTDRYRTPWGTAVNFDGAGSDEVRRFVIDNAVMWLKDYGADGLRIDAVHAIYDESAVHILEELAERIERLEGELARPLVLIAESDLNDPRLIASRDVGGYGMHAQWSDDFHHAVHAAVTGERDGYYQDFGALELVARALRQAYVYAGDYSTFRDRRHGRSIGSLPADRFLGFIQNHDQVGNRAVGERLSHLVTVDQVKLAAGVLLTSPLVPMLFAGEEWAASTPFQYFTSFSDEALGRAVSEGRRGEFESFGWDPARVPDPQRPETLERSRLRWDERAKEPHAGMLAWYRELIRLRRDQPELRDPRFGARRVSVEGDLLVQRVGPFCIVANFGESAAPVSLDGEPLLCSTPPRQTREGWTLAGHGFAVFRTAGLGDSG